MKQILINTALLLGLLFWLVFSQDTEGFWKFVLSIVGILMFLVALDYKIEHKNK